MSRSLKQDLQFFLVTLALTAVVVGLMALTVRKLRRDVERQGQQTESIERHIERTMPNELRYGE